MPVRPREALPLAYFIRRAKVLQQYRAMLRAASRLDAATAATSSGRAGAMIREEIRAAYRQNRGEAGNFVVNQMISEGGRQLAKLEAMTADASGRSAAQAENYKLGTGWPWAEEPAR